MHTAHNTSPWSYLYDPEIPVYRVTLARVFAKDDEGGKQYVTVPFSLEGNRRGENMREIVKARRLYGIKAVPAKWTISEDNSLIAMKAEGKSWQDMAEFFGRTMMACEKRYSTLKCRAEKMQEAA